MSEGYPLRPLGDVMRLEVERMPMDAGTKYRLAGVLNAGQGLISKGEFDGADTDYAGMNVLRTDQVVMRKLTAWEGPITVVPEEFDGYVVSNEFPTFTLGPCVVPAWMRLVCGTPRLWAEMKSRVSGTVQRRKRLNPGQLLQIEFPIPPLAVQERIIEVIGAIDDQVSALVCEATTLDGIWWGTAREMTGRLESMPSVRLDSIASISGGLTKNKKDLEQPDLVEVPYLRVANVHRRSFDFTNIATIKTTRAKAEALRLIAGDILMNEGGDKDKLGRGHVWQNQIDHCIQQNHVFRARITDDRFDPWFVSAWGNTFGQGWFETFGTQTTGIASINKATLSRFPIPDVDRQTQQSWVSRLNAVTDAYAATRREEERLRIARATLLGELLNREIELADPDGAAA